MCKECQWLELSKYVFEDNTQSVICLKLNRFLGWTEKTGEIKKLNTVAACPYKNSKVV